MDNHDSMNTSGSNLANTVKQLIYMVHGIVPVDDVLTAWAMVRRGVDAGCYRSYNGISFLEQSLRTAVLFGQMVAVDRSMMLSLLLCHLRRDDFITEQEMIDSFGTDVVRIVNAIFKVSQLYHHRASIQSENYQKLLLALTDDIRVILLMIVDRLALLRAIENHPDHEFVASIANEVRLLYAPLAHRLGLYGIKSELEDLSLKYLNPKAYAQINEKLIETKEHREAYVVDFIKPLRTLLAQAGLKFEIKGRTKTINSIWNKMKNKHVDLNGIYDLFAIRIIIDTPPEREKIECWMAYSIVTDVYVANPSRLKDWITIPKTNGYESLHITVKGPEDKWVEVQIRTKRMDDVAERGLAAHWRYKGIKSEAEVDTWMTNVRELLESDGVKGIGNAPAMNMYDKEVFVFTPKGDLFQLPAGATLLDFAFAIHTGVGSRCIGGKVDGRNQKINYLLKNGDTVEINTLSTQVPRLDWLNFVITPKARNAIRQAVNEANIRKADMARELVQRRFKNRKIDLDEGIMAKIIQKMGYKSIIDFYVAVDDELIDINLIVERYEQMCQKLNEEQPAVQGAATDFVFTGSDTPGTDILVIGDNVKGVNFKLSKCCNPILGDKIKGFVASDGAVKIHRTSCGNLKHLESRYPYRIIRSAWSGTTGSQFMATLKVVGKDDIGIVTNITSLINKIGDTVLRGISINSSEGSFEGHLVIGVSSTENLRKIIKTILGIKGVRNVERTA